MRKYLLLAASIVAGAWVLSAQAPGGFGPPPGFAGKGKGPAPAVDFSGWWTANLQEDGGERGAGPELVDYGGVPINEAARLWALSYDTSRLTSRYHQCDGYVAPYSVRAIGNTRVWEERDPKLQTLLALHWYSQTFEGHRVIWMDGRPHPPAYAPHSWMGFSTGTFVGNALRVDTTHLKQGWLRRNGLPESDQATLTEFFVRHGDHITYTSIVNDPVFLTEPWIRTTDFYRQPTDPGAWLFPCEDSEQVVGRAPDQVPNYLFGKHPYLDEYSKRNRVPLLGALGGAETIYGEFEQKASAAGADAAARALTLPGAGPSLTSRATDPDPHDGEIHVLPVRGGVYMLVGDGGNIVVQTGDQGAFVVDTGAGQLTDKVLATIRRLSERPIQYIANTSFLGSQTGGNEKLKNAGSDPSVLGTFLALQTPGAGSTASIMAHENVAARMNGSLGNPPTPPDSWPIDTYLADRRRTFHNSDSIEMFHIPNAITDGDSIVHFRRADVIVAGAVLTTTQYPFIDIANGGSVEGEIDALNAILARTVFEHSGEGGTLVIPGRGYLCDEHEVTEYRDMVAIVRDRVQALIAGGASLEQVKAAKVTADYDTRYGTNSGVWTTDMFVEAVYNSLKAPRRGVRN